MISVPPGQPQYYDPETEKSKQDFFDAARWGIWIWIAITLVPVLVVLACCGFCVFGNMMGIAVS